MNLIRPTTITDAMLTSSDVPETDYTEYSMATTYAPGDTTMDATGLEILTLDVAPATEWSPGDLLTGQTSSKTCYAVKKITSLTYYVRQRTGSFTLGEVIGVTGTAAKLADQGAAFPTITTATDKQHKVYEAITPNVAEVMTLDVAPSTPWITGRTITGQTSGKTCVVVERLSSLTYLVNQRSGAFTLGEIVGVTGISAELADQGGANPTFAEATNLARYPALDLERATPLFWKEVGATNRWKVFDEKFGSQTEQANLITYELTPGLIDSVALLNMDALSVEITLIDPTDGVVYNETVNLISTWAIIDWYTYFFEEFSVITDVVKMAIPLYGSAVLKIEVAYAGSTAKIGCIIPGKQMSLGNTLYSPSVGIADYSTKTADDDGNYTITEKSYSKKLSCDVSLPNTSLDEVCRALTNYRAIPTVWVGMTNYSAMIVYGFFKDFSIVMPGPSYSKCSLEIEGLT